MTARPAIMNLCAIPPGDGLAGDAYAGGVWAGTGAGRGAVHDDGDHARSFRDSRGRAAERARGGGGHFLVLDLLCCVPAILVLVRRCLDRTYTLRWSGSLCLIVPLAAWMALREMGG